MDNPAIDNRGTSSPIRLREILPEDDDQVADLIREVMSEFRLTGEGFAIHDPEVTKMSAAYPGAGARYFVLERDGRILGGGGFGRLKGSESDEAICELRKMYFRHELRGLGWGRRLLTHLLSAMRDAGYRRCYLETTSWMDVARALYEKAGFQVIERPLGRTGHHACDRFYVLDL